MGIVTCASGGFVSLRHRVADNAALIAQLIFELFLKVLHLLAQVACGIEIPIPVVVSPREGTASLRHFFPDKFSGELLLLSLAQDSERHFRSFGESLQQFSQLARLDQNLVVQHFQDVVLLNASSSSGAVRLYIIDNQPEAFRQTKLVTHDSWHLRCVYTEISDRNLRTFLAMILHSRRTRRLFRRKRCLRECRGLENSEGGAGVLGVY